ncbi:MAG: cytochrome c3 family protein [bacterium]
MFAVVFVFTAFAVTAGIASAVDHGAEFFDLNAQKQHPELIKAKDKRWVPHFPHRLHQEKFVKGRQKFAKFKKYSDDWTCPACHHKSEKKGSQPTACLKCKDVKKMLAKNKAHESDGYKKFNKIYHNNCRDGCHKHQAKADKAKYGFLKKCKTCHKSKPGKKYKYPAPRH